MLKKIITISLCTIVIFQGVIFSSSNEKYDQGQVHCFDTCDEECTLVGQCGLFFGTSTLPAVLCAQGIDPWCSLVPVGVAVATLPYIAVSLEKIAAKNSQEGRRYCDDAYRKKFYETLSRKMQ